MQHRRFLFGLLLAAVIAAPVTRGVWAQEPGRERVPTRLRELLRELDLTDEQKTQLAALVREHRGRIRSAAFREAFEAILTEEQKEKWNKARGEDAGAAGPLPAPEGMEVFRDLPYAAVEGVNRTLLSLDVYRPKDAAKSPVLVFIHGGGWRGGDKTSAEDKGRFFTGKGYVVVSVNYRLSPAVTHPVHIQDVVRSVKWVLDEIGAYGGDPGRLFVMGHSAGAHLAALAAADGARLAEGGIEAGVSVFKGVVLLDGAGYDIPRTMAEERSGKALFASAFGADAAGWKDASPMEHVKAGKGFAPFLILHVADREASRAQSRALAEALQAAGSPARAVPAQGKNHGTINREIGREGDAPTEEILRFFANLLEGKEPFADRPGEEKAADEEESGF